MQTIELPEKGIVQQVPDSWEELSDKQFRYVMQKAALLTAEKISFDDFKIKCFYSLAEIKRDWKTIIWEKFAPTNLLEEKNGNIWLLAQHYTAFLFKKVEPKGKQLELNFNTAVNRLPQLKTSCGTFYGPADVLSDLTFAEFRFAIEEMTSYFSGKDDHSLNRMIACLYRPAGGDPDQNSGRIREPFNINRVEKHAKALASIPHWERLTVLLWFTYCINYIQEEDLIVGGNQINLSPLFPGKKRTKEKTGEKKTAGIGWLGLLYSMSKEHVFGNMKETDNTNLFDVLLYMYDNHLNNQKLKAKSKR